ncbi:uncharacterized protein LOC128883574 [Hylaeus volcanicus]|uniref:uncharacterized protein LOC128883574 n=1 Tax=Hylaeus volcanicus TaxID=313075 RepID=UPI0023B83286|nr:uncharacterized protein LOC128883574 [Hylaeus volcanicus]
MVAGFSLNAFDRKSMANSVFPVAVVYAMFSAVFRAWCLEKAMHVCNGRGNVLHNHKVVMGICTLPFVALFFNEWGFFNWMPTNFLLLNTWQVWGCLVTAGTLPFMKNVVANRMIRHTGQAPWRILEIISMILIFVIGSLIYDNMSLISGIAFILVVSGRSLGMLDALSKDPNERRRAMQMQTTAEHGAPLPPQYNYDPTGVAESFEQIELPKSSVFSGTHNESNMESLKSSSHTLSQPFSTNPLL